MFIRLRTPDNKRKKAGQFTHNKKSDMNPTGAGSGNRLARGGEYVEARNVHDDRIERPQVGRSRALSHLLRPLSASGECERQTPRVQLPPANRKHR